MTPPLSRGWATALIALTRRFLFQSRHRRALRQGCLDVFEFHAARLQQHQQVKQQVGAFGNQMAAIVLDRGDDRLYRLLAKFLGAMLRTLVQQFARIGRFSARRHAGIDGGGKIMDRKTRHQLKLTRARRDRTRLSRGDLALRAPGAVKDRAASPARPGPWGPWLGGW